ncbi:hypothetical protein BGZ75_002047 [Mortierella antarctica]|nr:hypothetical protein BGZ75_002047 [Mortierella antarctica]
MRYPVALQTHNFLSSPSSPEPKTPIPGSEPEVTKIINCRILRDHKIITDDAIWIQDGKIIDPHKFFWYQKRLPDKVLDAGGLIVVPGFIEAQINGAFGVDFSVPSHSEAYERDLLKVSRGLLKYGTTSYCPTIVSSSASVYHQVLPHLKPRAGSAKTGATILGAHVEGPFINEARVGAHELKVLQASAKSGYKDFKDVYGFEGATPEAQKVLSNEYLNSVKIITCAPELEGVMEAIPDLVKAGITVSVGHSMANISQAEEAVMKGATFITHLFNAMPQFHHRDPGVIGLLGSRLDLPRPYYGLICDGIHVHPNSVKIAYDSHPEGVILVTDAMCAMGLSPGNYQLGNMNVTKEEDRVYIKGTDTLAGRSLIDTHTDTHIHIHTHTHQSNHQQSHDQPRGRLNGKEDDTQALGVNRELGVVTSAKVGSALDLVSSLDDVHMIKVHTQDSMPTPPGSIPVSPLQMTPGVSSAIVAHHSLPPTPQIIHAIMGAEGWTVATTHYEEYEEYEVYHDCEEHEGSEHSLRIITLHLTDEDEDEADEVATVYTPESEEIIVVSDGDYKESRVHRELLPTLLPSQHDGVGLYWETARHYRQEHSDESTIMQTDAMTDNGVQHNMSGCGCHGPNGVGRVNAGDDDEGDKKRSSSVDRDSSRSSSRGGPNKARADVNADGDLCCPSSSVITLDACMRNFIQFTSCSLIEALEAVTLHPAVLLGIQETKGVIKPGADADLVFLSDDLFVKRVFVAGEEVALDTIDAATTEKF